MSQREPANKPSPFGGHVLTTEDRRKGALAANKARTENAKPLRQRFAEKLEADADELYQAFRTAWDNGDWRAAQAAIHEAFGQPASTVNVDAKLTVEVEEARDRIATRTAAIAERRGTNGGLPRAE